LGDDHLTQKNFDHRKKWFEDKLKQLASNFGIDLLNFLSPVFGAGMRVYGRGFITRRHAQCDAKSLLGLKRRWDILENASLPLCPQH
jgi:hypothetical protein